MRTLSEVAIERIVAGKPTCRFVGKADGLQEETVKSTVNTAGIRVQASKKRSAEITSGRSIDQQGLAATCKDRRI